MIRIPMFDKQLMGVLSRIGIRAKSDELPDAIPGILFSRKEGGVICGCAFPEGLGDGCTVSGAVTRLEMCKTMTKIYKEGYVPVGMVMIFTSPEDSNEYPYGSVTEDRMLGFRYLRAACSSFGEKRVMLVVIDDDNIPYYAYTQVHTKGKQRKIIAAQLKKTQGGAVWISRDNWISSTLKDMGIKVLR